MCSLLPLTPNHPSGTYENTEAFVSQRNGFQFQANDEGRMGEKQGHGGHSF